MKKLFMILVVLGCSMIMYGCGGLGAANSTRSTVTRDTTVPPPTSDGPTIPTPILPPPPLK